MQDRMPHWLSKQAVLSPKKIAVELDDGSAWTFKDLEKASIDVAKRLSSLDIRPGSRVAVLSNNHIDMIVTIHALSYLQAVVVLLNTKLTHKELTEQLMEAGVMLTISTKEIQQSKAISCTPVITYKDIQELSKHNVHITEHIDLSSPFTMMFTSGTTGKPKMVIHTYGNHWWSAIGSTLNLGLHKEDKWLLMLPMYHVGGLSIILRSVITGMEVYLMEKYHPEHFVSTLQEKRITIASIVTVMLKDLLSLLQTTSLPTQVRCLLLGGGAVPETLLKQVKEKALPLFQSYGMTETSSQIVTLSEADALQKIGSSGKPLFPANIKIIKQNQNGVGEIAVKGPMVFSGYENRPDANQEDFSDGWFKTGDLGYIDSEGFLYVMERRTDLIISGGENIYPREIENVLLEMEGVQDVAAVGKPDEKWGQVPVVFVVVSTSELTQQMIIDYIGSRLASFKCPKEVYFIESIPRNATNKMMRHRLKQML